MLTNIGWGELFIALVVAVIVIGPEKLPGVIEDLRAAIFAARRAIDNAKRELNGEFGADLEEFRAPLEQVAKFGALGPRQLLAQALFEEDPELLRDVNLKHLLEEPQAATEGVPTPSHSESTPSEPTPPPAPTQPPGGPATASAPPSHRHLAAHRTPKPASLERETGGFSWDDIL